MLSCILNILYKSEASVRVHLSVPRSQRALTLYTIPSDGLHALLWPIYPVSAVVGS